MQLDHIHLREPHQSVDAIRYHVRVNALAFLDLDSLDARDVTDLRMLLEKTVAGRTAGAADQRQWAVAYIRQDDRCDAFVIAHDVKLAQSRFRIEHALGMRDGHAGYHRRVARGRGRARLACAARPRLANRFAL